MNCNKFYLADKKYLLSVIFLFLIATANSQTYHFDNYSVKEGLAQSSVYSIDQDKKGFVWLGTASGLSRFDGNQIINYTTEDGLADGAVKAIYIDTVGAIWLGHVDGGISRMYQGEIEMLFSMSADITSFAADDEGNLWVSSFGEGAIKISNPYCQVKDSITFQQYKGQEGLSDIVIQVTKIKNGNIYFITDVGVRNYNYQKNSFASYRVNNMPAYFQITCMYEAENEDQWFGSYNGGLYQYQKKTGELKIYDVLDGLASNWISTIKEDSKGNIWVGTWGGGVTKISEKGLLTINKDKGLKDNYIRCINQDREGNILFGTKEAGLLVYKGSQFISYGVQNGLVNEQVWAILKDQKGQDWFGTNEGISVFKNSELIHTYTEGNGLPFQGVRYIKKDRNNNIWIGTWGGGVMKYNSNSNRFDMNYMINSNMSQHIINALEIDQSNNLWVGTTDGLVYYEIDNQKVARLTQSNGLGGNEISTIFSDSKNVVWVGARGKGITRIDGSEITKIDLKRKITPTSIIEDQSGNLWIGTEGKGVLIFNGKKIIKEYGVKNGLLSDYISLLNIDDNGNIWIGSNKGLNKYDVKQDRFYSFSEKMGYVGIESKQNATYKDENGNLFFGTIKGVVKLNIKEETVNALEPLTQISNFSVNLEDREMSDNLELSYKEKSIVFSYSSICLTNPDEVYYQVMLEGLDEDWKPKTKQTFITYSPLPPGKYTFKVRASNNNGIWNKVPITYSFEIIPPLWQRLWFLILCAILLVLAIVGFIKIRERSLVKEKAILEEKVEERTEEVVQQSKELERKNKDIIDSITYAKRIQDAILPTGEMFTNQLSQTFILFKPKDIVSGDFYWLATKDDKSLFAAVDCTGHGVPGAFMSIVGYNLLDKIVGEYGTTQPDKILNELNKGVSDTLRQELDSGAIKDGMDISLCTFNKETSVLEYSGAYNPLYIISDKELKTIDGSGIEPNMTDENGLMLYEIKANRFPIGSYSEGANEFSKHSFKLNKGDTVYLFSDGYADQFGGVKGKKFRYKQFKQLLLSINSKSMEEQYKILNDSFVDWMGDLEQIDDVIVIGSRL
ncbi:MAG: SpoIIE family protein phosphatase [Flavobacteriales bacterium]|nr:SpoIIE family protein phosphatase [Flavobacteriales bacterium]